MEDIRNVEDVMKLVDRLFHENEIPMDDSNGRIYDAIEDAIKILIMEYPSCTLF